MVLSHPMEMTCDNSSDIIGANDEFEKQMVIANSKCSEFFVMMKKNKEQALLSPPFDFQVQFLAFAYSGAVMQK